MDNTTGKANPMLWNKVETTNNLMVDRALAAGKKRWELHTVNTLVYSDHSLDDLGRKYLHERKKNTSILIDYLF